MTMITQKTYLRCKNFVESNVYCLKELKFDEVQEVLDLLTKYQPKEEFIDADFTPVDEDKFADIDEQVTLEV